MWSGDLKGQHIRETSRLLCAQGCRNGDRQSRRERGEGGDPKPGDCGANPSRGSINNASYEPPVRVWDKRGPVDRAPWRRRYANASGRLEHEAPEINHESRRWGKGRKGRGGDSQCFMHRLIAVADDLASSVALFRHVTRTARGSSSFRLWSFALPLR